MWVYTSCVILYCSISATSLLVSLCLSRRPVWGNPSAPHTLWKRDTSCTASCVLESTSNIITHATATNRNALSLTGSKLVSKVNNDWLHVLGCDEIPDTVLFHCGLWRAVSFNVAVLSLIRKLIKAYVAAVTELTLESFRRETYTC